MTVEKIRCINKDKRRRRGNPGNADYAPELHQQLFHWVVDTIQNAKGRISSEVLKVMITMFSQELRRFYTYQVTQGFMEQAAIPRMPNLNSVPAMNSWIYRFRKNTIWLGML